MTQTMEEIHPSGNREPATKAAHLKDDGKEAREISLRNRVETRLMEMGGFAPQHIWEGVSPLHSNRPGQTP